MFSTAMVHGSHSVEASVVLPALRARGDDFDAARSDIDFVMELESDAPTSLFDAYFGLQRASEVLLDREVDSITPSAIENPFVRASIDQSRELVHGA